MATLLSNTARVTGAHFRRGRREGHQLAGASCFLDQSIQVRYRIQRSGPDPGGDTELMAINVKPLGDRVGGTRQD
jgi:hypothetical protein